MRSSPRLFWRAAALVVLVACGHGAPAPVHWVNATAPVVVPVPALPAVTTTTTSIPRAVLPTTHPVRPPAAARSGSRGTCDRPSTCPALRQCENGGSYAHGTSPQFDGAYQFSDRSAWGMTPEQQDAHADQMYAQRGSQPWPTCGRYLR